LTFQVAHKIDPQRKSKRLLYPTWTIIIFTYCIDNSGSENRLKIAYTVAEILVLKLGM
jgi:hypothetical protein